MNLTNLHDLPEAFVRAVTNDPYTGGGDISVTKLIDSPQVRILRKQYGHAVVEDVSDRIWSLLGQSVHTILERAGNETSDIQEERLFADVDGWKLSGQFDRMEVRSKTMDDYKVTSTYKVTGDHKDWERQLNVLRWLAIQNGYEVERLRIVAILRDFSKAKGLRDPDYPKQAVVVVPIEVWPLEETYQYIRTRINLHQQAESGTMIDCTDDERWFSGNKYALMKKGAKRAIKLYERREDIPSPLTDGTFVEERAGVYRRCAEYCEVAPFCEQYKPIREAVSAPLWESDNSD